MGYPWGPKVPLFAADLNAAFADRPTNADMAAALAPKANASDLTAGLAAKLGLAGGTLTGALLLPLGAVGTPSYSFAGDANTGMFSPAADTIALATGGSERVRITSTGAVGIGATPAGSFKLDLTGNALVRGSLRQAGDVSAVMYVGRYSAGLTSAFINAANPEAPGTNDPTQISFQVGSVECIRLNSISLNPATDNATSCGTSSLRWSVVYAGTGSINTSDGRDKALRGGLSEAELRAWGRVRSLVFQFRDAVEAKGDAARLHAGYVAQEVEAAFATEGLDAARYALWCSDPIVRRVRRLEDGAEVERDETTGESRLGLRYDQALVFETAWLRAKLAAVEERLAGIEARLPVPRKKRARAA